MFARVVLKSAHHPHRAPAVRAWPLSPDPGPRKTQATIATRPTLVHCPAPPASGGRLPSPTSSVALGHRSRRSGA